MDWMAQVGAEADAEILNPYLVDQNGRFCKNNPNSWLCGGWILAQVDAEADAE